MPLFFQLAAAFLLGAGLGWVLRLLSSRQAHAAPDHRLEEELRQQLLQRAAEMETVRQQLHQTAANAAGFKAGHEAAERMLAETRALHDRHLREAREQQEKALIDLRQSFQALSAEALRQNTPQFLQLAGDTLGKIQASAKGELLQRQEAIATLVQPLKEQLESYQKRLQQSETLQSSALGEVKKQLEGLASHSQNLSSETLQLRRVLSSNQARGRWGEETLRRVVEAAGMSPLCDFLEQTVVDDRKPDLVVRLPGDRVIIVDSKVPDLVFLQTIDAADPMTRAEAVAQHASRVKDSIRDLAKKDYPAQFSHALDYVVLFLPAESLFSTALEGDSELILWAAQKRVLLATPASLIGLLRAVSVSWQQQSQTENALQIAEAAQELYSRVATFMEHFEKIRSGLERANAAYSAAVGSYESKVRPSGERLLKLEVGTAVKELPEIAPLELTLRLPRL